MNIPQKLIDETLTEIGGPEALGIYKILKNKENVNEFEIAEKLKLTINQIRNVIYKFEHHNLVSSNRKKDRKKGWYIYFFTFNKKEVENLVIRIKTEKINKLKKQLTRETSHEYYMCPNQCMRVTTENALEHGFRCIECNSLLQTEKIEKNIIKLKKDLEGYEQEIEKLKV